MVEAEFWLCARVIPNTQLTAVTQQAKLKGDGDNLHCTQQHCIFSFAKFNCGIFPAFHAMRLAFLGFESNVFLQPHRQEYESSDVLVLYSRGGGLSLNRRTRTLTEEYCEFSQSR